MLFFNFFKNFQLGHNRNILQNEESKQNFENNNTYGPLQSSDITLMEPKYTTITKVDKIPEV
jgi:hypothetical protein